MKTIRKRFLLRFRQDENGDFRKRIPWTGPEWQTGQGRTQNSSVPQTFRKENFLEVKFQLSKIAQTSTNPSTLPGQVPPKRDLPSLKGTPKRDS